LLRKANQKRSLDDLIIQRGEFDWRSLFGDESALNNALGEVEDVEDARAAALATKEALAMEGADEADFGAGTQVARSAPLEDMFAEAPEEAGEEEEEGGTCVDYMVSFVRRCEESFRDWRV
jgi:helicase SWR1